MTVDIKKLVDNGLGGFKVLPVVYDSSCSSPHYLYYREHSVRGMNEHKPPHRTLFVNNIPPYANKESIKSVFSSCGKIVEVHLHEKPSPEPQPQETSQYFKMHPPIQGFGVAYVVFMNAGGLKKALDMKCYQSKPLSTSKHPVHTGVTKWCKEYNSGFCDPEKLQEEIDVFMQEFDKTAEEERIKAKEAAQTPDDEGWVTVTKGGSKRRHGIPRVEGITKKIKERAKTKRSKREILNFYNFQMRESKKQHIEDLQKRFEEDKKKLEVMKQTRKFKPF